MGVAVCESRSVGKLQCGGLVVCGNHGMGESHCGRVAVCGGRGGYQSLIHFNISAFFPFAQKN